VFYEETIIRGILHCRTVPGGEWHPVPHIEIQRRLDSHARVLDALKDMTRSFLDGSHYETVNPYCRPVVKEALKAIAQAEGRSSFGNDWMDALSLVSEEAPK